MESSSVMSSAPMRRAYEIRARGVVSESWYPRMRGIRIAVDRQAQNGPVSTLTCELPDEAALNGVLTILYTLGLSLISVQSVANHPSEQAGATPRVRA